MNDGIVLVLIPRDARGDEHCTIVYAGETTGSASAPVEVMMDIGERMASLFMPFPAWVLEHAQFGDAGETTVAVLDSPILYAIRTCTEYLHHNQWGFRPHISAVGEPRPIGQTVWFDRVALWYGEERRTWPLGWKYGKGKAFQRPALQ